MVTHAYSRAAKYSDLPQITGIYLHHVLHGTGSFEEIPPSQDDMHERMQTLLDGGYPYLVVEVDGQIAGFAYAGPYKLRSAYRFTVEDSIYVSPEFARQGIGSTLLSNLIHECKKSGFRQMMAVIGDSDNHASLSLHERHGFKQLGVAKNIGFKFERWLDIVYMQRSLLDNSQSGA